MAKCYYCWRKIKDNYEKLPECINTYTQYY